MPRSDGKYEMSNVAMGGCCPSGGRERPGKILWISNPRSYALLSAVNPGGSPAPIPALNTPTLKNRVGSKV